MLSCGHDREPYGSPLCVHLRVPGFDAGYCMNWYTGSGLNSEILCPVCAAKRKEGARPPVAQVCEECFEAAADQFDIGFAGGSPEIRSRPEPMNAGLVETPLPANMGDVVDIAPIDGVGDSLWLTLSENGAIHRFDCANQQGRQLACATISLDPPEWNRNGQCMRLHASPCGKFAAVVIDGGSHGEILELQSGEVTISLGGGDYQCHTVPYAFAFARLRGRTVAVHRTDWNRLDLSDPGTGRVLSDRPCHTKHWPAPDPEHYLDYFHGALYVSPDGTSVVDDGWGWHPYGLVATWSLDAWLSNPWESEDGPTWKQFCWREYYWGHGIAWLSDQLVAVGGIGDDDDWMIDGARVFDSTTAREIHSFAGPSGLFLSDGRWLYASDEDGLSRWDPTEGCRTGRISGFRPTRLHRGAGELAELRGNIRQVAHIRVTVLASLHEVEHRSKYLVPRVQRAKNVVLADCKHTRISGESSVPHIDQEALFLILTVQQAL